MQKVITGPTCTITAADPIPSDLQAALDLIHGRTSAHSFGPTKVRLGEFGAVPSRRTG
jgi:hypothetical protein